MIRVKKDLGMGALSCITAVIFWFLIPVGITSKATIVTNAVGPDYMPRLLCIVMFVLGAILVGKSILRHADTEEVIDLSAEKDVFLYLGNLVLFLVLMPVIGFLASAALMSILAFAIFREKHKLYYVIMAGVCVAVYTVFKYVLKVPLP